MYNGNTNQVQRVGTKKPNQLGLYDCSGNVWEWCYDTWGEIVYTENVFIYDESETKHRLRGGSWDYDADCCVVSVSTGLDADLANGNIGFRVVRTL